MIIEDNGIRYESIRAISNGLKVNKVLIKLSLPDNDIGNKEMKLIGEALEINKSLEVLNLAYSKVWIESGRRIYKVLKSNIIFAELEDELEYKGVETISEPSIHNKSLRHLKVHYNRIKNEVKTVDRMLKLNKTLINLYLSSNTMKHEGTIAITERLIYNRNIAQLELNANKIGKEGTKAFVKLFKVDEILIDPNFYCNGIECKMEDSLKKVEK